MTRDEAIVTIPFTAIKDTNPLFHASMKVCVEQAYYRVVSFSYKQKEDADKVSQALKLLGCYAETQAMADGYCSVVSYSYSTRERASELVQALKLFGKYAEVKGM